jgi:hypothetical protein
MHPNPRPEVRRPGDPTWQEIMKRIYNRFTLERWRLNMGAKPAANQRLVAQLRKLVKDLPVEVLGHVDAPALCCRSGTVAIVKIDTASNPAPTTAKAGERVANRKK